MKKLLAIALMAVLTLTASAQEGWSTGVTKVDELVGTKSERYYNFQRKGLGDFTVFDWDDITFMLSTDAGTFYTWKFTRYDGSTPRFYVKAYIGLYDLEGNLLEKIFEDFQTSPRDHTLIWVNKDWAYSKKTKKFLKRAKMALRKKEGYVRINIQRNNMADFDMKVMPLPADIIK